MSKIPTAEEFLKDNANDISYEEGIMFAADVTPQMLKDFAKLHVQAALNAAAENATMEISYPDDYKESNEKGLSHVNAHDVERGGEYGCISIEEESILNAYSENLIQ